MLQTSCGAEKVKGLGRNQGCRVGGFWMESESDS